MITKMDHYSIITLRKNGMSFRQIAKELNVDRKTASKVQSRYCEVEVLLLKSSSSLIPLEDDLVETIVGDIKYDTSNRGKRKLTDEIKQRVAEIIESEIMKTKYLGKTHKQKLTATQIHELLLEERFDVGLTTVTNYVRELRKSRETYFRQEYT